jgi:hypothetical protein
MSFRDIERLIDGEPLPAAAVEELDACFVVRNQSRGRCSESAALAPCR